MDVSAKYNISNDLYHLVNNSNNKWYLFLIYCVSSSILDAFRILFKPHNNSLRLRGCKLEESGFEPRSCDFGAHVLNSRQGCTNKIQVQWTATHLLLAVIDSQSCKRKF